MQIIIKNLQKKIPINLKKLKSAVLKVLSCERAFKKSGEITILFLDDKQIKELNLLYLGRDCPTDVIAFDNSTKKKELCADIVVSAETAVRNARIFKTTPLYEIYLYVIHGLLHILGYDDKTIKQRKIMENRAKLYTDNVHP